VVTIFWDVTPFSPLKVNRRFGGKYRLCLPPVSRWFLARLILWPWRWKQCVPPKRLLTLNGLHGVISQKIVLFVIQIYLEDICSAFAIRVVGNCLQHFVWFIFSRLLSYGFWDVMPCSLVDVYVYRTIRRYIPEDSYNYWHRSLRAYNIISCFRYVCMHACIYAINRYVQRAVCCCVTIMFDS
jgi:hypothetical protein